MTSRQVIVMSDGRRGRRSQRLSRRSLAQTRGERIERPQLRGEQLPLAPTQFSQLARLGDVVARQEAPALDAPPPSLADQQRADRDAGRHSWRIYQHVNDADGAG